jgi:uncharacterized membrane protein (UPF0127 family)
MLEMGRFTESPRKVVLGFKVPVATTLETRLLGLSFLDRSDVEEGLLIPRCRSVHTFGMRFAVDLLFLDSEGRVVELRRGVQPGRIARCGEAEAVLELPG